jgi:serine/threonine-protein kinase
MSQPSQSARSDNDDATIALSTGDLAALAAGVPEILPVIAGYVVYQSIGRGGCGEVYVAEQASSGRRVAIKVLSAEMARIPKMHDRFEREIKAVKLIAHPNIVEIYDNGRLADGRPYYAMELLSGKTIRELLRASGRMSCEAALAILEPVAAAVGAAHRAGVVHRDIKANNVVIGDSAGKRVVKLLDFGIARMEQPGSHLTTVGRVLGTPTSMAPEQIRGEPADERTDIYALGVLLYQLLTGELPFVGPDSIEAQHLQRPAPRPSRLAAVPPLIDDVVLRCMEKARERRYASVDLFLNALRRATGAAASQTTPEQLSVALYLDLTVDLAGAPDDLSWDAVTTLDDVERIVADSGFEIPIRTATMLLGIQALSEVADTARRTMQHAFGLAHDLARQLTLRARGYPHLRFRVCVHVDRVVHAESAAGLDDWRGPLLEIGRWVPDEGSGIAATASAVKVLGAPAPWVMTE